jgi:predicted metal-dependent phosphoesterase TrpH
MRLDTHVHTVHSGHSTIGPLARVLRESYNGVETVYRLAKSRGMDLVTITDHDRIDGVLEIAHRPDVIVGCEVRGVFPHDGVRVHLGVLGVTEAQHREIQSLRRDLTDLLPYLRQEGIFTSVNHIASRINGEITARHIAAILPWVDGLEVRNGSRLPSQNQTAAALAQAHRKVHVAGSDSHTGRGIGRTWIEAPQATTRDEFLAALRAGDVVVGGGQGHYFTMASDICRILGSFYVDRVRLAAASPLDWRRHAMLVGGVLALPLVLIPLVVAAGHFILEQRFNRDLLVDLVSSPGARFRQEAA